MSKVWFGILCLCMAMEAQDNRHINPETLSKSPAYSHAVSAKPGTIVWVSGQVSQNAKGEVIGKGDLKAQLNQVWENVRLVLAASGASFRDVVKTTTFVVNYKPSMRQDIRDARVKAMGDGEPPASTLVGVQSLATEDYLVEIEVTAVVK